MDCMGEGGSSDSLDPTSQYQNGGPNHSAASMPPLIHQEDCAVIQTMGYDALYANVVPTCLTHPLFVFIFTVS